MKRIYFDGLTEIRAIAALFVLFHHIELYKFRDGLPSLYDTQLNHFISHLGENGVTIFFVLSGFLITYLLLTEKGLKQAINIKSFYLRRILRIWPLYYLIVLLSFTVIPLLANNITAFQNETHYYNKVLQLQESPYATLILFLLFLPNFALVLKPAVAGAAQSWSVGVEEQFYIVWPHVINRINSKVILIICFVLICLLPQWTKAVSFISPNLGTKVNFVIEIIPIHIMAIGGIGAFCLYYYKEALGKLLKSTPLFVLNTLLFISFLFVDIEFSAREFFFGCVIIAEILFVIQTHFQLNLRQKQLEKIGEISYGVYMYHPLMMYICFSIWNTVVPIQNGLLYNVCIYTSIVFSTLVISKCSFKFFESKFIAVKNNKFSVIESGK
jgi:peptidoglycan/LPS O-acetylase OafA/YrhL